MREDLPRAAAYDQSKQGLMEDLLRLGQPLTAQAFSSVAYFQVCTPCLGTGL
jgi:hypothetical protein